MLIQTHTSILYSHVVLFLHYVISIESVSEDGESSLASIYMYSQASLQPLHESSRHTHYGGQAQLPGHHSRVGEEAAGRERGRKVGRGTSQH